MTALAGTPLDASARRQRRHFLLRRLHSLSGIVPVGAFLMVHIWTNAKAVQGRTCFDNAVSDIGHIPFLPIVEWGGILLPLFFHAIYGVVLAYQSRSNVGHYGYARNWLFTLQRVTGVIAFVFIVLHLKDFYFAKVFKEMSPTAFFPAIGNLLGNRWQALLYVVGVTASVFHFANGIRTFLFAWGVTVSERSQRYAGWACAALGAVLWFMGANTVLFFATGGGTFAPPSLSRDEAGRDACAESLTPLPPAALAPHAAAPQ